MSRRRSEKTDPHRGLSVRSPDDAFALFAPLLSSLPRERIDVAFLTRARRVIAIETFAEGSAAAAVMPVAAILREAVARRATGFVLAHNHPSGDAMPSLEDIRATKRLAAGAAAIDVDLIDHVVLAADHAKSFRLLGLL